MHADGIHFDGLVKLVRELSKPCGCEMLAALDDEIECHAAPLNRAWYIAPIVGRNYTDDEEAAEQVDSEAA